MMFEIHTPLGRNSKANFGVRYLPHSLWIVKPNPGLLFQGLSTTASHSAATFSGLRPPNLANEPMADKLLKLLLPSLKFDFLDLLGFERLCSSSKSFLVSILTTTSWLMLLRQNGQTGAVGQAVVGLGFLWQHRARVQWAHIWWPHGLTSIVHAWSKHMQHSSTSLACLRRFHQ